MDILFELSKRRELVMAIISELNDRLIAMYFSNPFWELKDDNSFLSEADKDIERWLRDCIAEYFPNDGIIGEEFSSFNKEGDWLWTIDPIDGSSSFIYGVPLFGTLIGLIYNRTPVFGFCTMPVINEMIYAEKGKGCWWKPKKSKQFIKNKLIDHRVEGETLFSYSAPEYFKTVDDFFILEKFRNYFKRERMWGDCFGHILVATGRIHAMLDPQLSLWDWVPIKVIVEESGGEFIDLNNKQGLDIDSGVSCAVSVARDIHTIIEEAKTGANIY